VDNIKMDLEEIRGEGKDWIWSALFWDIAPRRVVIIYRRFGQLIGPIVKGQEVK
jgi:hypothetical protein